MHRHSSPAHLAGSMAFALIAFGIFPASAADPDGKAKINTYHDWDKEQSQGFFGCPNSTTYGQVITIPANVLTLDKVTFSWQRVDNDGSLTVRAEVYTWDGNKATSGGALWESAPRTISYADFDFHKEVFKTGGIPVVPGAHYVIFASIDKDFEACTDHYILSWGSVDDTAYSAGTFVYQNNQGDESRWTDIPWSFNDIDLAFKATFHD